MDKPPKHKFLLLLGALLLLASPFLFMYAGEPLSHLVNDIYQYQRTGSGFAGIGDALYYSVVYSIVIFWASALSGAAMIIIALWPRKSDTDKAPVDQDKQ